MALDERKERILSIIVDAYVSTVHPIGSQYVAKNFKLRVSPATIRNEMGQLEEMGYITHPHTSAGRTPTDRGYRYYVDHLLSLEALSEEALYSLEKELEKKVESLNTLMENVSRIVSTITHQTAIITYPLFKAFKFQRVDLIRIDRFSALAVWLTTSGWVQDQTIYLGEEVSEESLKQIENLLNTELVGMPFYIMEGYLVGKLRETRDSLFEIYRRGQRIVGECLKKLEEAKIHLEGSSFMLEKPEFQDVEKMRSLFNVLQERGKLCEVLRGDFARDGVTVHIGRENLSQGMWDCSLITASYHLHGKTVGSIGVLGPRRMEYATAISLLDSISKMLSGAVSRL